MTKWLIILTLTLPLLCRAEALMLPSPSSELRLIGAGPLRYFGFHVYDASTWSERGESIKAIEGLTYPFALQIRYARDIRASDLIDKTRDAWRELSISGAEVDSWLATLKKIWPDVKENDVIVCYVNNDGEAEFYINGELRGTVLSREFARAFLSIWLDQNAEFKRLQQQLTGVVR